MAFAALVAFGVAGIVLATRGNPPLASSPYFIADKPEKTLATAQVLAVAAIATVAGGGVVFVVSEWFRSAGTRR